ncbi:MAG TPA: hypothetical protein VJW51_07750 [Candidatus Acidoferrales bacterium]|nr:hypothetical protein [Candidatus Acidoferrales bacterium]
MFVVVLFLLGFVVMGLWNWLMPEIFGLPAISYWQAMGLTLLCKILFGGFGASGGRGGHRRRRLRERWEHMTPEEREKLRQGLRGCWGRVAPPDSKPSA